MGTFDRFVEAKGKWVPKIKTFKWILYANQTNYEKSSEIKLKKWKKEKKMCRINNHLKGIKHDLPVPSENVLGSVDMHFYRFCFVNDFVFFYCEIVDYIGVFNKKKITFFCHC